jgi:hypothetical protein
VWERKYHGGVHSEVSAEEAVRDSRHYLEAVFKTFWGSRRRIEEAPCTLPHELGRTLRQVPGDVVSLPDFPVP